MKDTRKRIMFMQKHLNQLIGRADTTAYNSGKIYSLSTQIDKEIVKYYKSLNQH